MKDGIIYTLVTIALVAMAFLVGQERGRNAQISPLEPKVDTLFIRDTIRPEAEVKWRTVVDSIPYPVPHPVEVHDTIYLPRTQIVTGGEDFTAWISGFEPELDSILIFPKVEVITKQIPVPVAKRWSVGITGGVGIAATDKGLKAGPYIGVGVSYSLFSW